MRSSVPFSAPFSVRTLAAMLVCGGAFLAACGSGDGVDGAAAGPSRDGGDRPTVAVTTNILADVVGNLAGDEMDVVSIMPVGADPHDFQASAQQVNQIREADVLIVNGAGFEEGLVDVIESAEADGVATFAAVSAVATIDFGDNGHEPHEDGDDEHADEHSDDEHSDDEHSDDEHSDDEHADDEHSDDEHSDDEHSGDEHADDEHGEDEHGDDEHADEHGDGGVDPHFFTDPARMVAATEGIVEFLIANVDGVDAEALEANAAAYIGRLQALDGEAEDMLAGIPEDRRVLVTNHEVFGYFADRYGFEVIGTVIPGGSTVDGVSAGALADLAELVENEGVPAIFADTSSADDLARTLAAEVGIVEVVELYSESLGAADSDGATYLDMISVNAERIAAALAP